MTKDKYEEIQMHAEASLKQPNMHYASPIIHRHYALVQNAGRKLIKHQYNKIGNECRCTF
jgi:hypothetical protein